MSFPKACIIYKRLSSISFEISQNFSSYVLRNLSTSLLKASTRVAVIKYKDKLSFQRVCLVNIWERQIPSVYPTLPAFVCEIVLGDLILSVADNLTIF